MRVFRTVGILALLGVAGSCMDLDVANINDPDADRALAEPSDVEALLGTGFYRWINGTMKSPAAAWSVQANEITSSWGNYGMRNAGTLPRGPYDNSPTAAYPSVNSTAWGNLYEGLSNVADGLLAVEQGMRFADDEGNNTTERARVYGKFVQGVIHGWLASFYDQAVIFDEAVLARLEDEAPELQPYSEVMDRAIAYLEEAISLAESAPPFEFPSNWIHGNPLNNAQLIQWSHSFAARYLVNEARTPAERQAVDWDRVLFHLDRGVQEAVGPVGDQSPVLWWHRPSERPTGWVRAAYDLIGPADTSGNYEEWLATDPNERSNFLIHTDDRRITGPEGPESRGKYVRFVSLSNVFPTDRGQYFQSAYYFDRFHRGQYPEGWGYLQPIFLPIQQDHMRAEALLRRGGDRSMAIDLINRGRVENGELPPLPYVVSDNELWRVFAYEKAIEQAVSMASQNWFDRRGLGTMICGSNVHYPVPGAELETLRLPNYSFGGSGEGAAIETTGCRSPQADALSIVR
ncbi:MAG TPA: hypothetical protein VMM79_11555 [Longimicrobiales bacterium]|nr:hypothetical protein [Longimicrobiales bacterium]